jgi:hypothetical protein
MVLLDAFQALSVALVHPVVVNSLTNQKRSVRTINGRSVYRRGDIYLLCFREVYFKGIA